MSYPEFAKELQEQSELADVVLSREITSRLPQLVLGVMRDISNPVAQLREILRGDDMSSLIENGNITIGMIKPRLDIHMKEEERVNIGFSGDSSIVDEMINRIPANTTLDVLATISIQMTPEMVEEFYAGSKQNMQGIEPDGRKTWNHFHDLMASGPVTFIVLGSPSGDAIKIWRDAIGSSWDVTKAAKNQFRYLMSSNENNGFHGSDSTKAVKDEIGFITKHII